MARAESAKVNPGEREPALVPFNLERLTIKPAEMVDDHHAYIRLTWQGQSAGRNPSESLMPYFRKVIGVAAGLGRMAVEMHFEEMEFFNSVTVAALIQVIEEARDSQVPLVFVYDQKLKWQELNFRAVRAFVTEDGQFQVRSI